MHHYKYIIIGSSAAGISALNTLGRLDPDAPVLCISASKEIPYNTCLLIDLMAGRKSVHDISLRLTCQNSKFMVGTRVIAINREKKSIITSDNSEILYQKLLIATGVRPYLPPIAGIQAAGVFMFHTLSDVQQIRAWIEKKQVGKAIVIGAGLTGLECADVLHAAGISITIVEKHEQILARHVTPRGAQIVQKQLYVAGIQLVLNASLAEIIEKKGMVSAILLADGREIAADMVIIAAGVQPNSELAHNAHLALHGNHIAVGEYMETSDPSIFTAGDLAMAKEQMTGALVPSSTWADAVHQGMIAAQAMSGDPKIYPGILSLINSSFFGLKFAAVGMKDSQGNEVIEKKEENKYVHILLNNNIPESFQYLGKHLEDIALLRRAVLMKKSGSSF